MNKDEFQFLCAGFFVGFVLLGAIFFFTTPTPKVNQGEKMKECIEAGGEFAIRDWSWHDDGSDYRMTCDLPERELWRYEIRN